MACIVDFTILILESLLILVTPVLFCCLHLSARAVDPAQICYILNLTCFIPQYTSTGPSTDKFTKSIMDVIWQSGKLDSLLN